jgi:hypothetical protein
MIHLAMMLPTARITPPDQVGGDRVRVSCTGAIAVACRPVACHHAIVTDDLLLDRARGLWTGLAGARVAFTGSGIDVGVSARSLLCPAGWVGIVELGNAAIATAPDDDVAGIVRRALGARVPGTGCATEHPPPAGRPAVA